MTPDEKAALADVYERAAEYLEEYGWRQDDLGYAGEPRCFLGGVESALEQTYGWNIPQWLTILAWKFPIDVLELPRRERAHPVASWNDNSDRTKDEVINTLHALANKLR